MKTTSPKLNNVAFLFIAFIACSIAIIQTGCKSCNHVVPPWQSYITNDTAYQHIPADPTQQIVVWRTPGTDGTLLDFWLDSVRQKCGDIKITVFCGSCDSSLMLLTGAGIKTYIQGDGGTTGGTNPCNKVSNPNCGPSGSGDTLYWSVNFPVNINDVIDSSDHRPNTDTLAATFLDNNSTPITIAVFDTGVDTLKLRNNNYLYRNNTPVCLDPTANNGWNFPAKDNDVWDDFSIPGEIGHGATVSELIVEQVKHYAQSNVKILPVKIHNSKGQSDLFSVLCGFAYAEKRGANIINASFGYYAAKRSLSSNGSAPVIDSSSLLFKKYIQYYLTQNNILLIAAAGNQNDLVEKSVFTAASLPIPADLRNLDNVNFYPASFASDPDLPNVIAVTTIDTASKTVSPDQNYSPNVVDIGVFRDIALTDNNGISYYYFQDPRFLGNQVRGSSYATPIVTGIIGAHYHMIQSYLTANSLPFNKQNILNYMLQQPFGQTTTLNNKIKTGVMFNKALPY
jgi:hypothetical protein